MSKQPTRFRISARDAEDLTKIVLDDAIKVEEKRIEALKLPKPLEAREMRLAAAKIAIPGCTRMEETITFHSNQGTRVQFAYYGIRLDKEATKSDIEVLVSEATMGKVLALATRNSELEDRIEGEKKKLHALNAKRQDYKDLAARFRLGFTGNPNDTDDVNAKCKTFLYAGIM